VSAAIGRVTAFLARLEWRGILAALRPARVVRGGSSTVIELELETGDSAQPGERWVLRIVVRLPDSQTDQQWSRRILAALADAMGHELGEAVWLDGHPVGSPHDRPLVWPWRVADREET